MTEEKEELLEVKAKKQFKDILIMDDLILS